MKKITPNPLSQAVIVAAQLVRGALKSPPKLKLSPVKLKILPAFWVSAFALFCMGSLQAQYIVDFEGPSETKGSYASGTVTLSGLDWNMTDALIGTDANDWKNGARSARLRGYGSSSMTMLENKSGVGTVSFYYRRYSSDSQVAWKVEYSTDNGISWTQLGSEFTATATVQLFSEVLDIPDDVRIRISSVSTGSSNRRMNVDDLTLTDYGSTGSSVISVSPTTISNLNYEEGNGPSASQSFTLSGTNLTEEISFSAGTDFEFSYDDETYTNQLSDLNPTNGEVSETTIYARLAAGLSSGTYSGNLIISSADAEDVTVELSGAVGTEPAEETGGLIISQYIEANTGSPYKGIELWNMTGSLIDFSDQELMVLQGTNGGTPLQLIVVDSGTLAPGQVMVIGTPEVGTYLNDQGLSGVLFISHNVQFNGDDALVIELGGITQDVFGNPGEDPGSAWSGGGVSTVNENIQILCGITSGDTDGWSDPSERFEYVANGSDMTGFGLAPDCGAPSTCSIDNVSFSNVSACNEEDNTYTVDITVTYTDAPEEGSLIVNGSYFPITGSPQTESITGEADGQDVDVDVSFSLEPTCSFNSTALFTAPESCLVSNAQGLVISQYIEHSSTKGIELWNQTGETIDFEVTNLVILKGTNGGVPSPEATIDSGTLSPGAVMVVGTSDIGVYLSDNGLSGVFYHNDILNHNGDDAFVIELNGVVEDVFGLPGNDPGSSWNGNGVSTEDQNIALKCDITTGDIDGWSDPSERFETIAAAPDLTGFGVPPLPCGGTSCSIDNVTFSNLSACNEADNSYTVDITVEYSNAPAGNLLVNGESFAVTTSPQTVTLTGDADGQDVDVEVSFSLDPTCTSSNPALFTAPEACVIPDPVCGFETFTLAPNTGSSYSTISYTGDDGYSISATDARTDQDINGDAITVRDGSLTVSGATGGIGSLTMTTQRVFAGGTGDLQVLVNGFEVGLIPYSASVQTTTIEVNMGGVVDIEIVTPHNGDRIVMDDLTWTCFSEPFIFINNFSGNTAEDGTTTTFEVSLGEEPATPVELSVSSADEGEVTVSPETLTFDNSNWGIPQLVTLTGVPDGVLDGDQWVTITVATVDANSDPEYHGLTAEAAVLNEDIDACAEPTWEVVDGLGSNASWSAVGDMYSANGYCGGGCEQDVETWLIFGPLDLSATGSLQLAFEAAENFGTTDLVVQYSTDYTANPCPANATWNGATTVSSAGSINVDLAAAAGQPEVYLGISYIDDGANGYSEWILSDFEFIADVCPVVGTPVESDCSEPAPPAPANNDCVDAQPLPVPTFPAISNALGTLYGATNSGLVPCFGNANGGDVYYSFTIAQENHVAVTVNPFAGADVVVEVLDACAGNTIACIDNGASGAVEAALLQNLAAGTYFVRIHNYWSEAVPQDEANFLINVQQFPYASVQDNPNNFLYACNQSGFTPDDFVGATPQLTGWILDYQWLIGEVGGGVVNEWQRGEANYSTRISWLGMEYGATYNVFVRVLIDHPEFGPVWSVYPGDYNNPNNPGASGCTISTASNVTPTELRPNYSPTNASGNDYSLCDIAIAYNVQGSENFRWRFDPDMDPNNGNEIFYTRGAGNPSVMLRWVNGLVPGSVYNVAVEVQVDGQWSGYSTVKPIILALPPNDLTIRAQYCNTTMAPNGVILSNSVCKADYYTFEFENTLTGALHTRSVNGYSLLLTYLNPELTPGEYSVRVRVTQNGVSGDFGPACLITIDGSGMAQEGVAAQRSIETVGSSTLFPNPNAGSEIRVQLDGLSEGNHDVNIVIYDIYGKQISSEGFGHEGAQLNRLVRFEGNLSTGMYMVQILVDGEQFATERLIVK